MKAKRIGAWLLLALLGLACVKPPQPGGPKFQPMLPEGEKRPLEVVLASPQGLTSGPADYQAITVVFNQPMKPLTGLDEAPPTGAITLNPVVEGELKWKGTATLEFVPKEALPYGTEFEVTLAKGITSWAQSPLEEDYKFRFQTPGPSLKSTQPKHRANWISPDTTIKLFFDQGVDPEKVADFLVLYHNDGKTGKPVKVEFTVTRPAAEPAPTPAEGEEDQAQAPAPETVLEVKPSELKTGTQYFLKVKAGLPGLAGTIGSNSVELIAFDTFGDFKFEGKELEKQPPGDSVLFHFSNPVKVADIVAHVKIEPSVEIPESYQDDEYSWTHQHLYLPLEPRQSYKFTLDGQLKDKFGNALGKEVSFTVKTGDREPMAHMPEGIAVMESVGPRKIPVGLLNIDKVHVDLARLDRSAMLKIFKNEDWNYSDKAEQPSFGKSFNLPLKLPRNESVDRPVDLASVLKKGTGFIYYQAKATAADRKWTFRGLVQVTNLALTAKFSNENIVVMTSSLDKGEAKGGVDIEIVSPDGKVVWQGVTEKDGTLQAPGWVKLGLKKPESSWETPDFYVFASAGGDQTFVRSSGFGGIYPWDFDVNFDWSPDIREFQAHGFSERGLYRAGEEVFLKGVVREKAGGKWQVPELKKLEYKVEDSREQEIAKGELELNKFGSFDHKVQLKPDTPTGTYRVHYSLPEKVAKDSGRSPALETTTFRVEAFEPAQFEVTVETGAEHYIAGDKVDFSVKGWYLFGAPMKGESVSWTARLEPMSSGVEGFEGYDFGPTFEDEDHRDESTRLGGDEGQLDDEGLIKPQVDSQAMTFKGDASLVLEGTVTSPTRQTISGRSSVPLYRGEFRIGLKPASSFVEANKPVNIKAVAVTPKKDTLQGEEIKLELIRREWNSVRKADVDGRYRWVVEHEDKLVAEQSFRSAIDPVDVPVTPPESGFYVLRATSKDDRGNQLLTTSYLYAYGGGYVAWARSDDDKVELVADKTSYKPGETAKILVKSPYEKATALVTLERELVMSRWVVELDGSADTIDVPLQSRHLPNVYVSVVLLQGRQADAGFTDAGEDLGKPSFKIGYVNLPVAPDEKRLQVSVKADKETYGPGDEVSVTLETKDAAGNPIPAEVSLSVADVGVLGLIGYETPDYFDSFYRSRPLGVRSAESRLDVIGQRAYGVKGESSGGGGGLAQEYRKDFKYTAYWNPSIETDDRGQGSVTFTLPENLSTFKLMATALTRGSEFGSADARITVNKPLLLKPSVPRFFRVGDQLEAGVLAFNNSQAGLGVSIEVKAEGVEATSHTSSTVALEPGEEKEILFSFKASKPGTATLSFKAEMGSEVDGLQLTMPVMLPQPTEAVATFGKVTDQAADEEVQMPESAMAGTGEVQVSIASTALVGLDQTMLAMLEYPYGCLEQRITRVAPLILADELVTSYGLEGYSKEEIRTKVQETLDLLPSFRCPDNGLGVWTGSDYSHPYLTAHVMLVAKLAAERDYKIDPTLVKNVKKYLSDYVLDKTGNQYPYSEAEQLTAKAAAVAALARWEQQDPASLSTLFKQRNKMTLVGRVYLLQAARLMKRENMVATVTQELENAVKVEAQTAHFEVDASATPWVYGSTVRDTALIVQALMESDTPWPLSDRVVRWLLEARRENGVWSNTQENFAALYALVTYRNKFEAKGEELTARVSSGDQVIVEKEFTPKDTVSMQQTQELAPGQKLPLKFDKDGKGPLYYGVRMSYAPALPAPPRDRGFAVFKSYHNVSDGKPAYDLKAGETYLVKLSLVTPTDRRYVVLNDPVPAGLEVVQTTFETESKEMSRLLAAGARSGWWTFSHTEIYDHSVRLFADGLAAGEHSYQYLVRARLPGTYEQPATKAEEMYHPEIFGTSETRPIEIR